MNYKHLHPLRPQQAGRQTNLQGATGWGLPPGQGAGALSSSRHRQGARRSPPAAQTTCALRSFSATPSLRNLLAAFLAARCNVPPRLHSHTEEGRKIVHRQTHSPQKQHYTQGYKAGDCTVGCIGCRVVARGSAAPFSDR